MNRLVGDNVFFFQSINLGPLSQALLVYPDSFPLHHANLQSRQISETFKLKLLRFHGYSNFFSFFLDDDDLDHHSAAADIRNWLWNCPCHDE